MKVKVFPVLPYAALVGLTVIAPSPSTAGNARGAADTDADGNANSSSMAIRINEMNVTQNGLLEIKTFGFIIFLSIIYL